MNGPEHYSEGIRLLTQADRVGPNCATLAARATAHLLAAQIALTVDKANGESYTRLRNSDQWKRVVRNAQGT